MNKLFAKLMANYLSNEKGLVTIEWVGIAAVVVVAGIIITGAIMEGTAGAGASVVSDVNGSTNLAPTAAEFEAIISPAAGS